jgi:hypothetical protein
VIGCGTARGNGRIAYRRFSSLRSLPTSEWGPGGFFSPGRMEMAPGGISFFHPAPNECSLKAIWDSAMYRVPEGSPWPEQESERRDGNG